MNVEVWNLFRKDYNAAIFDNEKVKVVKNWGQRFIFPMNAQVDIIKTMIQEEGRDKLRAYFEKDHKTSVICTWMTKK